MSIGQHPSAGLILSGRRDAQEGVQGNKLRTASPFSKFSSFPPEQAYCVRRSEAPDFFVGATSGLAAGAQLLANTKTGGCVSFARGDQSSP